ncbi:MAG: hypothetical protein J6X77_00725 [Bacteroidales bacterium]|nr:hypothetical protein [Bacteroidales bacterium]
MENPRYYHFCANGAETKNYILSERDYYANFNLFGVCAANSGAVVVSFSIEDSHPHGLLWGTRQDCLGFMTLYENQYRHYAARTRPPGRTFSLHCELYPVLDENYLLNVAAYTIIQPTKDGKPVMYYDYLWGTGSMYFRSESSIPVWYYDKNGSLRRPVPIGQMGTRIKRELTHSQQLAVPDDWLVCNGFILPSNYVDVARFEGIYQTHNRFRVFTSSPRQREEELLRKMAEYRGVSLEDMEARSVCGDICKQLFGFRDPRRLDSPRRITLAQQLRRQYRLSFRQLSTLVYVPENELRRYVRT